MNKKVIKKGIIVLTGIISLILSSLTISILGLDINTLFNKSILIFGGIIVIMTLATGSYIVLERETWVKNITPILKVLRFPFVVITLFLFSLIISYYISNNRVIGPRISRLKEIYERRIEKETIENNKDEKRAIIEYKNGIKALDKSEYHEARDHFIKATWYAESNSTEISAFVGLGDAYRGNSEFNKSENAYKFALSLSRESKDKNRESEVLNRLGELFLIKKEYGRSVSLFWQSYLITESINYPIGTAYNLKGLGQALYEKKCYEKSVLALKKSADIFKQEGDDDNAASVNLLLGSAYRSGGDLDNAEKALSDSYYTYQRIKNKRGAAEASDLFGIVLFENGDIKRSLAMSKVALDLTKGLGNLDKEAELNNRICTLYIIRKDYHQAIGYGFNAVGMYRRLGAPSEEIVALDNLGFALYQERRVKDALNIYFRELTLVNEQSKTAEVGRLFIIIGDIYLEKSDPEKATLYYKKAKNIYIRLNDVKGIETAESRIKVSSSVIGKKYKVKK